MKCIRRKDGECNRHTRFAESSYIQIDTNYSYWVCFVALCIQTNCLWLSIQNPSPFKTMTASKEESIRSIHFNAFAWGTQNRFWCFSAIYKWNPTKKNAIRQCDLALPIVALLSWRKFPPFDFKILNSLLSLDAIAFSFCPSKLQLEKRLLNLKWISSFNIRLR